MFRTVVLHASAIVLLYGCSVADELGGGTDVDAPPGNDGASFRAGDTEGAQDAPSDTHPPAEPDTGRDVLPDPPDEGDASEAPDTPPGDELTPRPPEQPEAVEPCVEASCWETSLQPQPCWKAGVSEDFSSGKYNVHRYSSAAHAGGMTTIQLKRTGGQWQPALLVTRKDGTTLSDGLLGATAPGLEVTITENGTGGGLASLVIATEETLTVDVFVTGWGVVGSGYGDGLPLDATYELAIESACEGQPAFDCSAPIVNGNPVAEPACGWLHHIGQSVVPQLAGSLDERLDVAAPVAWWALKEGVLYLDNPIVYSNCNFDSGDKKIGPLETCASGHAWQVGLSGVQVPTFSLEKLEQTAALLFPGVSTDTLLEQTAVQALLAPDQVAAVVSSGGTLRRSWLLRHSAIGFTVQVDRVVTECVQGSKGWCYGSGWTSTKLYAPTKAAAIQSIADIRALLKQLAP